MAIVQAVCNSFKLEALTKVHNLSTDTLKIALYTNAAMLGPDTTVYTTSNEVVGAGYTAGGNTLAGVSVTLLGATAVVTFTNPVWSGASFTARGALVYNSTASNKAIAVLDFGADVTAAGTPFTVNLPPATATTAAIRFA